MKKVYNIRFECDAPHYVLSDEEYCNGLKEVLLDELGDDSEYVTIKVETIDKDQRIAELEKDYEKLRESSCAIYCALADILEKENPCHVPSRIDQLTGQYLAEYADMWQGYKLKNSRIEKLKEENNELKESIRIKTYYVSECNQLYDEQQKEMVKLQEQLKNTATSKFKTYQPIFYISHYYTSTKGNGEYAIHSDHYYVAENENEIIIGWNYAKDFNQRKYSYVRKDWVFATEAEAQKYLEEHK